MIIKTYKQPFFVFDLDDTLFTEIDFLKSAFKEIASFYKDKSIDLEKIMLDFYHSKKDVFQFLVDKYPEISLSKTDLINIYRDHKPNINLYADSKTFIQLCINKKINLGLITDGRSITQRNKLKALGIENIFKHIIISEEFGFDKYSPKAFLAFKKTFSNAYTYYYIGDNLKKDFYFPNKLDWKTICLKDRGLNIHPQNFIYSQEYMPNLGFIDSFNEIEI